MCGCDCCITPTPTCFDVEKPGALAWCGCDCANCVVRLIGGAMASGTAAGFQRGVERASEELEDMESEMTSLRNKSLLVSARTRVLSIVTARR